MAKNKVLLTVSGNIPPNLRQEIEAGDRPRTDYLEMSKVFGADLIDYQTAEQLTGLFGKLVQRVAGKNALLAWACFRQRKQYESIFTDGEQVGLPYALFLRLFGWMDRFRPAHLMITHRLTTRSKSLLIDRFKLQTYIDRFVVYSTYQQKYICDRWHLPVTRVPFTPFMVDQQFFSAEACAGEPEVPNVTDLDIPIICSIGRELRDYPTLLEAVKDLDIHTFIATSSLWSKREDQTAEVKLPANVTVMRFTNRELRQVYSRSEFVVVPLLDSDFQAGVTTILEGMALGKAVICSKTDGQSDVIEDGSDGIYVTPEDPLALRNAILTLVSDKKLAQKMGKKARQKIDNSMNLDAYTARLNQLIQAATSGKSND